MFCFFRSGKICFCVHKGGCGLCTQGNTRQPETLFRGPRVVVLLVNYPSPCLFFLQSDVCLFAFIRGNPLKLSVCCGCCPAQVKLTLLARDRDEEFTDVARVLLEQKADVNVGVNRGGRFTTKVCVQVSSYRGDQFVRCPQQQKKTKASLIGAGHHILFVFFFSSVL